MAVQIPKRIRNPKICDCSSVQPQRLGDVVRLPLMLIYGCGFNLELRLNGKWLDNWHQKSKGLDTTVWQAYKQSS